jgi:hypothetical protein
MTSYPIYGGPLGGSQSDEATTIYTYQNGVVAALQTTAGEGKDAPPFVYGLIERNGHRAFVPVRDADLVQSHRGMKGGAHSPEAETLRGEIDRRKITS